MILQKVLPLYPNCEVTPATLQSSKLCPFAASRLRASSPRSYSRPGEALTSSLQVRYKSNEPLVSSEWYFLHFSLPSGRILPMYWTISSSKKVTYVAAVLSSSGYKYIIQARERGEGVFMDMYFSLVWSQSSCPLKEHLESMRLQRKWNRRFSALVPLCENNVRVSCCKSIERRLINPIKTGGWSQVPNEDEDESKECEAYSWFSSFL